MLCFTLTLMHKNIYGNNCFSYPFSFQILLWKFLVKVVWIIQNTQQSVLDGPGKNQFLNATKIVVLWGTTVVNLVLQVNFHFSFFYTVIYDIHHFWSSLSQFFFWVCLPEVLNLSGKVTVHPVKYSDTTLMGLFWQI